VASPRAVSNPLQPLTTRPWEHSRHQISSWRIGTQPSTLNPQLSTLSRQEAWPRLGRLHPRSAPPRHRRSFPCQTPTSYHILISEIPLHPLPPCVWSQSALTHAASWACALRGRAGPALAQRWASNPEQSGGVASPRGPAPTQRAPAAPQVEGSGFRVQGSGFRIEGSGFRIQDSGLRVEG
jgi:hypothetical protein